MNQAVAVYSMLGLVAARDFDTTTHACALYVVRFRRRWLKKRGGRGGEGEDGSKEEEKEEDAYTRRRTHA